LTAPSASPAARAASLLVAIALAAGLLLASGALVFERRSALAPERIEPAGGHAFFAPLTLPRPTWLCPCADVTLFEDGRPLGPSDGPSDDVAAKGGGRFSRERRGIAFSTRDDSDPRSNGRRYEARVPVLPPAWALAALAVALVVLRRDLAGRALAALERASPGRVGLALTAVALVYRVAIALRLADASFANVMVGGSPWSDAWGYYAMGAELSVGERWDPAWSYYGANRPFYHALLGALFGVTGPSVAAAQTLQIALGAAATGLVFDAVRRLASRPVALVAALVQALSPCDARYALAIMTESLGNALGVGALWAGALGLERLRTGTAGAPRAWLGMGFTLALANLARPVSLPATALLPLAAAATLWRDGLLRARRAPLLRAALALGLGVALPVGAWVARQQIVHGIPSLSGNTAEVLYAATSPAFGTWTSALRDLVPPGATRGEHYAFFQQGVRRNLREHPGFYARNALHYTLVAAKRGAAPRLALVLVPLLVAVACLRRGARRGAAIALGAALAAGALTPTTLLRVAQALALAAPLVVLLRREPLGLVACVQLASFASMGLTAIAYPRVAYGCAWMSAACLAQLVAGALRPGATGAPVPIATPERIEPAARLALVLALVAAAVLALGALVVTARNLAAPTPKPSPLVAPELVQAWITRALAHDALAPLRPHADGLRAERAATFPDAAMRLAPYQDLSAWSPLFAARPFAFRVERMRPGVQCEVTPPGRASGPAPGQVDRRPPARAECVLVRPESLAACPAELVSDVALAPPLERLGRIAGPTLLWIGASVRRPSLGTSFEVVASVGRDAAPDRWLLRRACGADGAAQVALVVEALSTDAVAQGNDSAGAGGARGPASAEAR